MMRKVLVVTVLGLAAVVHAQQAADRREVGNLVMEGVPEIPRALIERSNQYTNTRGASLVGFDPQGDGILIATRFGETAQMHHVAGPGMDRQQWTFFPEPVTSGAYDSKEGTGGFYFRMDAGGSEFYQLYWFDRARGQHAMFTDGKSRNQDLLPSNGGGKAAFSSTRRNKTDFDIYTVENHDPATVKLVKEVKGQWSTLDWSKDDSRLLLQHYVSINESYLHLLDLQTGTSTQLNPRRDAVKIHYGDAAFSRAQDALYYTSDEGSEFLRLVFQDLATGKKEVLTPTLNWDVSSLAVSDDGAWLAYVANEGGRSALYLASTKDPKKAARLELPPGVIGGIEFDPAGKRLGFTMSTPQSSSDVYVADVATRQVVRWTQSETGGLNTASFVMPQLIEVQSFDKQKTPAWFYKPANAAGKLPVIINIHGGPEGQSMTWFDPTTQLWVNELGAAVLVPNVRGSSGYGKSYLLMDNGMKREDSVKDIGRLLDWIATQPDLDKDRVAVFGGSYGGYMVLASMVHFGDRLKCAVDIVGISSFVTFLERTEDYRKDLRRAEYGDERDPKMRAFLEKISPLTNAARIKKPLYVIQGLNDPRVPVGEAEQIVKTVRTNGGPVWYLLAKDEGHGFQKKRNRDFLVNSVSLFFQQHLLQ